jgi:hypothetical protein
MSIFLDITPSNQVKVNRLFGGIYRLHFQGEKALFFCLAYFSTLKMKWRIPPERHTHPPPWWEPQIKQEDTWNNYPFTISGINNKPKYNNNFVPINNETHQCTVGYLSNVNYLFKNWRIAITSMQFDLQKYLLHRVCNDPRICHPGAHYGLQIWWSPKVL